MSSIIYQIKGSTILFTRRKKSTFMNQLQTHQLPSPTTTTVSLIISHICPYLYPLAPTYRVSHDLLQWLFNWSPRLQSYPSASVPNTITSLLFIKQKSNYVTGSI